MPGYTLPGGVLKNKFGATNKDELAALEVEAVARRLVEFELEPPRAGAFDAEHLKAIHQHLFQDVYQWAGHTRDERFTFSDGTVATEPILSKADGRPFLVGPAIPSALDAIGARLRGADKKQNFDWNSQYVATLTPGQSINLVFAGVAGDQFMARTATEILFGKISDLPQPPPGRSETFTVTATHYAQRDEQNTYRG